MLKQGIEEEELFCFLEAKRNEDFRYDLILSSMCTRPHPVAIRAHNLFMETNLGDPGLFPGTHEVEQILVSRFAELFSFPKAGGYATSGGTESNIQALRIARQIHKTKKPNVILPTSAHFSCQKACDMLGLEMRCVPPDKEMRMDTDVLAGMIDTDTCGILAVAGTTEYGVVDPIPAIAALAKEHDIFFHVDAAFGGLVLPFLPGSPAFDFSIPGVSSISVDPHKMGMSTIPAGVLMVRDPLVLHRLNVDTPYLTVKKEFTLAGTRSGASVAGALAVLDHLGRTGMEAVVSGCMENTRRIIGGMEAFGIQRAVTPDVNVATFMPCRIPDRWIVSTTRNNHVRIVCMPHVTRDTVEAFLEDIGELNVTAT